MYYYWEGMCRCSQRGIILSGKIKEEIIQQLPLTEKPFWFVARCDVYPDGLHKVVNGCIVQGDYFLASAAYHSLIKDRFAP